MVLAAISFWNWRSAVQAVMRVKNWAAEVKAGTWRMRGIPLPISLDIKNAFGLLPWSVIIMAMRERGISSYLIRQIREWMRWCVCWTHRKRRFDIESLEVCHRAQFWGLCCGSWLMMRSRGYNNPRVELTAYADDQVIMAWGCDKEEMQQRGNHCLVMSENR